MCLPILGAVAVGTILAGTAVSVAGQISAGNFNDAVAKANARNLNAAAEDAIDRGDVAAQAKGKETAALLGRQRAVAGAGGADLASGSALDILTATAGIGQLDQLTLRNNASREAWGFRTEAQNALLQGRLAKQQSKFGAASTLLTGLGGTASTYANFK